MKMMPAETDDGLDNLYAQQEPEDNEGRESIDQEEAEEMQTTAVVPVKLLQGEGGEPLKVGDEVVVKVQELHGDEATIIYAPKEETPAEPMAEGTGEKDLESLNSGDY